MWIKICGISDVETARSVAQLGPNAVGLVFYGQSPRCVSPRTAAAIVRSLPDGVEPVGVFVNHSAEEIESTCRQCGIRTAQLHGDEPPESLARLQDTAPELNLIRAYRLGSESLDGWEAYLVVSRELGVELTACLIDARIEGHYGGTGQTVSWNRLAQEYRRDEWPPLILAGGLRPENVPDAIRTAVPWGVDVSSGVESSPGQKDLECVARFIDAARQAFTEVETYGSPEV